MAKTIRFLALSAFLLILPTDATPPVTYSRPLLLSCRTIRSKTAVIRKYLLLQRFRNAGETQPRFRIYDITVTELEPVAPAGTQQRPNLTTQFAMGDQEKSEGQEAVHGRANHHALLPVL